MPRIPTYLASADYRPPRGDLSEAGVPGRMLAQFGASVGDLADAIGAQAKKADLAKKAEQAQAEAERARGTAQAWQRLRETIDGFEQDSDPDTIMDRWQARRGEIGQEISAGIANPEARAETERDFDNLAATQTAFLRRHVIGQIAEQGRRDLDDHLAAYADHAIDARHPVEWDDAVDLALREIHNKAAAGFITAAEADSLEQGFHADIADRQAQRAIAVDPQAALADLKGGEAFAALPAERRARLIDEAGRAVQAQALRQQTEAAAAKRTTLVRLPGYMESLRDGDAPDGAGFDRDSLIATLGQDEGEQRWTRIEHARAFGKAMSAVRWAAPDEIAEKLKAETDPDSPLHQAVVRRDAQLSDKPADYVLKNPHIADLHAAVMQATSQTKPVPAVSSALQAAGVTMPAVSSDEDRRAAITAYANASLAEQERLGVPEGEWQVLPEAEAQDLVAQITAGDPPQADRTLRGLAADWGDAWPIVSADLERAGLPGEYRLLAGIENPAARQTFVEVLSAQAKEPGAIRAKIGADADAIDDIAERRTGEGLLTDDRSKPVKLLAYHYARFMEPEAAVDRALADLGSENLIVAMGRRGGAQQTVRPSGISVSRAQHTRTYRGDSYPRPNAVDLHDNNGKRVMSIDKDGNPQQVQIPEGVDLRIFARQGEADNKLPGDIRGETIRKRLENFRQGGIWDLQRPRLQKDSKGNHIVYSEFINAATLAIGVYCAAAGLTRTETLAAESIYAVGHSNFGNAKRHWFWPLPERNVINTNLGYDLYVTNTLPGPAE
jgi:hypothetical protein